MAELIRSILGWNRKTEESDNSATDLKEPEYANTVKKTWVELMEKRKVVGKEIYDSILLKEVDMSRLFLRTPMSRQQDMFMLMLDSVINLLDDPSNFERKLQLLSKSHHENYGVKKKHYKHFRQAFMKAIKKNIEKWTEEREEAWMWFWDKIINIMTSYTDAKDLLNTPESELNYIKYLEQLHTTFETILFEDPQSFAEKFYGRLLNTEPDIALLFSNKDVHKQSIKFIAMLRHAIRLLDDKNSFSLSINKLAQRHLNYGVQIKHLNAFGKCFTETLKEECTKKNIWNDTSDSAWSWFWTIIVQLFDDGMKDVKIDRIKQDEDIKQIINQSQLHHSSDSLLETPILNENDNNDNNDNNNNNNASQPDNTNADVNTNTNTNNNTNTNDDNNNSNKDNNKI